MAGLMQQKYETKDSAREIGSDGSAHLYLAGHVHKIHAHKCVCDAESSPQNTSNVMKQNENSPYCPKPFTSIEISTPTHLLPNVSRPWFRSIKKTFLGPRFACMVIADRKHRAALGVRSSPSQPLNNGRVHLQAGSLCIV
jgi:hypothetical protein